MHVTLVDICWTLYSSNTTYDFCRYVAGEDMVCAPMSRWLRRINVFIYRLTGIDMYKSSLVNSLKGMSRQTLEVKAQTFVDEFLEQRRIAPVWNIMPRSNVVLLSATLDIVAEQVAKHIGALRFCATQLNFDNEGLCQGTISNDLQQRKHLAVDYDDYDIFTDNHSDIALISRARHATIVVYGNHDRWSRTLKKHHVDVSKVTFIYASTPRY
ncbi:MAG TPA: hypothetical protein DEO38_05370 [Bacteroidales bacterium]|nr:hypothetical protein [Bacteroidales bacterium]